MSTESRRPRQALNEALNEIFPHLAVNVVRINWRCRLPCKRKLLIEVLEGRKTARRTCQGCRRLWVVDLETNIATSTQANPRRSRRGEG
jgi:hypothetical protein